MAPRHPAADPFRSIPAWLAVSAITAVGLLLRSATLGAQPLWYDEGLTIVIAQAPVKHLILRPVDTTPGLYYLVHKLLFSASASAAEIRLAAMMFGVAAIPAMYVLGRLCFGVRAGLLSAALLAVWPQHIAYSQEARAYSLLFLLTLGASVGLVRYVRLVAGPPDPSAAARARSRRAALTVFGLCDVLSFHTHMVAVFWIAATSLLLLIFGLRRRREIVVEIAATFALMAVAATPGLWRYMIQLPMREAFNWLPQASPLRFVGDLAAIWLPNMSREDFGHADYLSTTRLLTILLAILGSALAAWRTRRRLAALLSQQPMIPALIAAYLAMPLLLWLFGFVVTPIYLNRNILFSAPGFILLVAALDSAAAGRKGASVVTLLVVAVYAASALLYLTMRTKADWREAGRLLAAAARPGDALLLCDSADYPAMRHAATAAPIPVLLSRNDGSWFVIESTLGSDSRWDKAYYTMVWRSRPRQPRTLSFAPGSTLWRLDSQCSPTSRAAMDERLRPLPATPALAWSGASQPRLGKISVTAYRFSSPFEMAVSKAARE